MRTKKTAPITGADITAHINEVIYGPAVRLEEIGKRLVAEVTQLDTAHAPVPTGPLLEEAMSTDSDLDAIAAKLVAVVTETTQARERAQQNRATADALKGTAQSVRAKAHAARSDAHVPLMAYLSARMAEVAEQAAALGARHPGLITLAQVQSRPEDLLVASQEQGRIMGVYRTIRAAQREAYRVTSPNGSSWVHLNVRSGLLRDAIDHEAHWVIERHRIGGSRQALRERVGSTGGPAVDWYQAVPAVPWPATKPAADHPGDDLWTWLVWASENAELWVPTIEELEDADTANQGMLMRPPVAQPRGRTASRRPGPWREMATRPVD